MATTPFYRLGYEAWNEPMSAEPKIGGRRWRSWAGGRATHRLVGNVADIDGYHIVVGAGSGLLIPASFYGLYEGRDIEITGGNPVLCQELFVAWTTLISRGLLSPLGESQLLR